MNSSSTRKSYTTYFKCKVLNYFDRFGKNKALTAKRFGLCQSLLTRWDQMRHVCAYHIVSFFLVHDIICRRQNNYLIKQSIDYKQGSLFASYPIWYLFILTRKTLFHALSLKCLTLLKKKKIFVEFSIK